MSKENLKFLSSKQALKDTANFISRMSEIYHIKHWIVFGCSYSGTLAAWMRLKYPHLVLGAISSSGPLYAKLNFREYFQVIMYKISVLSIYILSNFPERKTNFGLSP